MSLLLEALKKAEQAKQQVKGGPPEEKQPPAPREQPPLPTDLPGLEFGLEPVAVEAPPGQERHEAEAALPLPSPDLGFPDLAPAELEPPIMQAQEEAENSQPAPLDLALDLGEPAAPPSITEGEAIEAMAPATPPVAEEPVPSPSPGPAPEPTPTRPESAPMEALPPPPPPPEPPATAAAAATAAPPLTSPEAGRKAARNIFASKGAKGTPARRKLLLAVVGIASVLAGGMGYYYWQLLSTTPTMRPAPIVPAPVPQPTPEPQTLPAAPEVSAAAEVAPHSAPSAPASGEETGPKRDDTPAPPPPRAKEPSPAGLKIVRGTPQDQVDPLLLNAYQSYMAGDAAQAETAYRQVLRDNPRNRDALLGLATIAAGRQQASNAVAYYLQMLELDPRDAAAQAGLINFQSQADPVQNESRLKNLMAHSPETGFLHFALGNLYAQQSRWSEAQQEYFEAFGTDATNADYAFNLAISLDHLNQAKPAAKYYEQALSLAATRPAAFDRRQAQERLQALSKHLSR